MLAPLSLLYDLPSLYGGARAKVLPRSCNGVIYVTGAFFSQQKNASLESYAVSNISNQTACQIFRNRIEPSHFWV